MNCPDCLAETTVLETRGGVIRRRECFNGHRFSTEEVLRERLRVLEYAEKKLEAIKGLLMPPVDLPSEQESRPAPL